VLEKFQAKYGFEGFEEGNKFLPRNLFRFKVEFEWKIREASRFEIQYKLLEFEGFFKNLWNLIEGLLIALRWHINSWKEFGNSNLWVYWFAARIWFEFIWIFTLAYLELDYQWLWFLIKILLKVITKAATRVVTALPLKRNLLSRFMEGAQETRKDTLTAYQEGQWDSWKEENFLVTHATFPFARGWDITL
jgi:hypothetical protein